MFEFYLSLGSNLGDRLLNLSKAINHLSSHKENKEEIIFIEEVSSVYVSSPIPSSEQPNFFNIILKIKSKIEPIDLLDIIKVIELDFGRDLSHKNQPRIIDIDIIFVRYSGNHILIEPNEYGGRLEVPHPRAHLRAFVLMPLLEIDSDIIHPLIHKTIKEIFINLEKQEILKLGSISY